MSLLANVKHKLLDVMIGDVANDSDNKDWRVLLVDKESMRIINASCRMYDVMERGITVVEDVAINRQPLSKLEAIYFLTTSDESIDFLIRDFDPNVKKKLMYAEVHIFFTTRVPDQLFQKIKQSKVSPRIKTFKELNIDFLTPEPQMFHFNMPDSFTQLFAPNANNRDEIRNISRKLVSMCATLGELPYIRHSRSPIASALASAFQDSLDKLPHEEKSQLHHGDNRPILLILDRSIDTVAPVLHEFTYQAMIYDLCKIKGDCTYKYSFSNGGKKIKKEVLLDDYDFLWPKLRHMHIADCINKVIDDFNAFMRTNKAVKLSGDKKNVGSLKEMTAAMKEMPQFQEQFSKYSLHIRLAGECMEKVNNNSLQDLAYIEQDLSTGKQSDGSKVKGSKVYEDVKRFVEDRSNSAQDKARLLMTYLCTEGDNEPSNKEFKTLLSSAGLPSSEKQAVENLALLRSSLDRRQFQAIQQEKEKKKRKERKKNEEEDLPYAVSRYVPIVKQLVESLLDDQLPTDDFPYLGEAAPKSGGQKDGKKKATSLKSATRVRNAVNKGKERDGEVEDLGPKVIVFVAGGVTHSEIRSAYELLNKREVIIGGTSVLTPQIFVNGLASLTGGGGGHRKGDSEDIETGEEYSD